jgi:hypothetical protein
VFLNVLTLARCRLGGRPIGTDIDVVPRGTMGVGPGSGLGARICRRSETPFRSGRDE